MSYPEKFNSIRCYSDEEVPFVVSKMLERPEVLGILKFVLGAEQAENFLKTLPPINTVYDFQKEIIATLLTAIEQKTCAGVSLEGIENINKEKGSLFLTNHRDIVLDSAFLNLHLHFNGFNTSQIAIGNNLLIQPWIEHVVRLNKSFIVRRDGSIKQQLLISKDLSEYIRYVIAERKESVWMAQREGRSKDSNDITQSSIIKMLNMSGEGSFVEKINELNITPIAINYEYDACDFLKAKEFQQKRDNADFKKTPMDDLISMQTGILGKKGRVSFNVCEPIILSKDWDELPRTEQVPALTEKIDKSIYAGYILYPNNYVAADLYENSNNFSSYYNESDKEAFKEYVENQLKKIDLSNPDYPFLRNMIYKMYAYPVLNQQKALEK